MEKAQRVLCGWRDYADGAPDELFSSAVIITAPPEEFVSDHLKGRTVVGVAAVYVGDPQTGASVLRPIKDLGPEVDLIQPMPFGATGGAST